MTCGTDQVQLPSIKHNKLELYNISSSSCNIS